LRPGFNATQAQLGQIKVIDKDIDRPDRITDACTHVDYPLALPRKARVNPSSLSHLRRDRETDHLQDGMRGLFVKETMSKS
jgi:hypothetical protein